VDLAAGRIVVDPPLGLLEDGPAARAEEVAAEVAEAAAEKEQA